MSRPVVWAWAGAAVSLLLALALFDPYLFTGGDNVAYYALARALATGRGYVDLITPGAPLEAVYPPGFPLLLVPFYWIFGGHYVPLKLESWAAAGVALWALWRLAREDRAVPPWAGAAAIWLVGLAPVFQRYTHWVLSDMSFTAVSLAALYAFTRATNAPGEGTRRWTGAWLAGCLIALGAFAVRTAGLTLLVAALAVALLKRQWARALTAAGTLALGAIPWLIWTAQRPPSTGGYLQQATASDRLNPESGPVSVGRVLERTATNLERYAGGDFPRLFWPGDQVPLGLIALAMVLGVALIGYGAWRAVQSRGLQVWDVHLGLTVGILLAWPWWGDRFFLTVAPLLWLTMLVALDGVSTFMTKSARAAQIVAAVVVAVLLVGTLARVPAQWKLTRAWLDGDEMAGYAGFWQDYFEASGWIGRTDPEAVIAARKPTFAWYWSGGRPSMVYPFHRDVDRTWRFFHEQRITHLLVDPMTAKFLAPVLEAHTERVAVVHAGPERLVFVLRIEPPAGGR